MIDNKELEHYVELFTIKINNSSLKTKILLQCNQSNYTLDKIINYLNFLLHEIIIMNFSINDIELFLSDSHNFGLSVTKVIVAENKVFYIKPKNSHSSLYLNYIIKAFFSNNFMLDSNIIKADINLTIEEDIPFNKPLPAKKFSIACGRLLALLFFIDGRDMHLNNFTINSFGFPQIIDSETIFHNDSPKDFFSNIIDYYRESIFAQTPLVLGMLPHGHTYKGITYEESGIKGLFMKISTKYKNYDYKKNISNIILGFTLGFNEILAKKYFLLSTLPLFPARHIFRPTKFYAKLIKNIMLLETQGKKRELLYNELGFFLNNNSHYRWIIEREVEDLLNYDIPIFTTYPTSSAIYRRNDKVEVFFKESSYIRMKVMLLTNTSSDISKYTKAIKWSSI